MKKLSLASLVGAFLLASCSSPPPEVAGPTLATYCIREATVLDNGNVLLDMPGYPRGMDDIPREVSRETYDDIVNAGYVKECASDDPRMVPPVS